MVSGAIEVEKGAGLAIIKIGGRERWGGGRSNVNGGPTENQKRKRRMKVER